MISIESAIIGGILRNSDYCSRVLPYLKEEYFHLNDEKILFGLVSGYIEKYAVPPSKSTLLIEANDYEWSDPSAAKQCIENVFSVEIPQDSKWLLEKTEEFCRNKAVYNAITTAIEIYDGSNKTILPHAIPDMVRDAVSISFDTEIGHDFIDDAEARFDFYTRAEHKIPFDIDILNQITNGGITRKTLNIVGAGVNVGKTLSLIHLACGYIQSGYNVLYISMEMSEEAIMQRVDANMLDIDVNNIPGLDKSVFLNKISSLKTKTAGKLKVKEYPPGVGNSAHFKHLLIELKNKKGFVPDIMIVDYIGITGSSKIKAGSVNSYFYIKSVSEELRALAVEFKMGVWSATQLTRAGMADTDAEMTDTAESMGLPATADFILLGTRTEELDAIGQIMMKQLKNRYGNKTNNRRFSLGISLERQRLYSVSSEVAATPVDDVSYFREKSKSVKDKFASLA